jgi:hypothetical protein
MASTYSLSVQIIVVASDHTQWHTHTHTHSVGLLWTRDQAVAETSTSQYTTSRTDNKICPGGIQSCILESERPQTHALDRAAISNSLESFCSFF